MPTFFSDGSDWNGRPAGARGKRAGLTPIRPPGRRMRFRGTFLQTLKFTGKVDHQQELPSGRTAIVCPTTARAAVALFA